MIRVLAGTFGLFVLAAQPVRAEDANRFQIERNGDGYVRLDRQTGQLSSCKDENGSIVCRMAADDRKAYDDMLGDLHDRIDALESRVAALEGGKLPPAAENRLPTDEEFDKTMGLMERFFRRFMGIVKEFEAEDQKSGAPAPDRT